MIKNEPDDKKKWKMYMEYLNEKKYGAKEAYVPDYDKVPHVGKF
jgi:hypothetical protein